MEQELLLNPVIYCRDVPSPYFHLILHGKVQVCTGEDGFLIDMSNYSHLGENALLSSKFKPDFSAKVIKYAQMLRISREAYMTAISSRENISRTLKR